MFKSKHHFIIFIKVLPQRQKTKTKKQLKHPKQLTDGSYHYETE